MCFVPRNQCGMVWEFGYLDVSNLQNKWIIMDTFCRCRFLKIGYPPDWSVFVCFCSLFIITGSWFFENLVPFRYSKACRCRRFAAWRHPYGHRDGVTARNGQNSPGSAAVVFPWFCSIYMVFFDILYTYIHTYTEWFLWWSRQDLCHVQRIYMIYIYIDILYIYTYIYISGISGVSVC